MWYIESGDLKGTSQKEQLDEAFIDILDMIEAETDESPYLGVIAVASQTGFDFESDEESLYFLTIPILAKHNKLFSSDKKVDNVLSAEFIDAPNSIIDRWDDVLIGTDGDKEF